jgi:hypothetical protein
LLGKPFEDALLVGMAYAYEQAVMPRRPPDTTPELVNGHRPPPVTLRVQPAPLGRTDSTASGIEVQTSFRLDGSTRVLEYTVLLPDVEAEAVLAVVLGRGTNNGDGPVLHRLTGPGLTAATGAVVLAGRDLADLRNGDLYLRVYAGQGPQAAYRGRIVME